LGEFSERNIPGPVYAALNAAAAARSAGQRGTGAAGAAGARGGARAGGARPSDQPPRPPSSGSVFIGDKGVITAGEYGGGPRLVPMSKMEDVLMPLQMLDRTPGTYNDWIAACKGGEPACSNFDIAGPFTEWIALGVVACRIPNTKLLWDSARMRITNNAAANEFLKPKIRKGWRINWTVKT
jgi:hypothetical protein